MLTTCRFQVKRIFSDANWDQSQGIQTLYCINTDTSTQSPGAYTNIQWESQEVIHVQQIQDNNKWAQHHTALRCERMKRDLAPKYRQLANLEPSANKLFDKLATKIIVKTS